MASLWKARVELANGNCAYRRLTINRIERSLKNNKECDVVNAPNWFLETVMDSLAAPMLKSEILEITIEPTE